MAPAASQALSMVQAGHGAGSCAGAAPPSYPAPSHCNCWDWEHFPQQMSPAAVKRLTCEPDAPTAALQFILIPCFCSGCGRRLCFISKFYDSTITVQGGLF